MIAYQDIPVQFNVTAHFLDRNVEEGRGDRVALYCDGESYSYQHLTRLTKQIGNVLKELGVRPEERIVLALGDSVDFVASWYAVLKIGAVVGEVYTFIQPKDFEYYLNYSSCRVVIADATTREKIRSIAHRCPALQYTLLAGDIIGALMPGEVSLNDALKSASTELDTYPTTKDHIGLWKFTTGSTGTPKAAVHCHHDPLVSFENYGKDVLGYQPDDLVLPVPKMFFGYARDATTLFPFGVGAAGIVFADRSTPERLFQLIEQYRPTIMVQVPTMVNAMVNHPDAKKHDLSSIRRCISSGEALPLEVYEKWRRLFGVEVLEGIGSSELYHIYVSNRPGQVRPGSCGQMVPGYTGEIVDSQGRPLPNGEAGELWVSGESCGLMYWNDHAKSKKTFLGDTVHTGDLFTQDEDGYFWYKGRADDLLKVGGIWVAPVEIEQCLLEFPGVVQCAVVAYAEAGLVLPRAFVVLQDGLTGSPDVFKQMQDFVRSKLSPHKYPRDIRVLSDLPKTGQGKVDRKSLSALDVNALDAEQGAGRKER